MIEKMLDMNQKKQRMKYRHQSATHGKWSYRYARRPRFSRVQRAKCHKHNVNPTSGARAIPQARAFLEKKIGQIPFLTQTLMKIKSIILFNLGDDQDGFGFFWMKKEA